LGFNSGRIRNPNRASFLIFIGPNWVVWEKELGTSKGNLEGLGQRGLNWGFFHFLEEGNLGIFGRLELFWGGKGNFQLKGPGLKLWGGNPPLGIIG